MYNLKYYINTYKTSLMTKTNYNRCWPQPPSWVSKHHWPKIWVFYVSSTQHCSPESCFSSHFFFQIMITHFNWLMFILGDMCVWAWRVGGEWALLIGRECGRKLARMSISNAARNTNYGFVNLLHSFANSSSQLIV